MSKKPLNKLVETVTADCEKMLESTKKRIAQWKIWHGKKPTDKKCHIHETVLTVNEWNSVLSSNFMVDPPELVVRYSPCGECLVEVKLVARGVPENLKGCSLTNFIPTNPSQKTALTAAKNFTSRSATGFLILGSKVSDTQPESFGIGKTHLAVSVLRDFGHTEKSFRFITQSEFLTKLRQTYRDEFAENIVESLKNVKLLALDEIGMSVGGKDELPTLHEILNHRYGKKLRTIITTNKTPGEFREAIGPRMADRLREATFAYCQMEGKSGRPERRSKYIKK